MGVVSDDEKAEAGSRRQPNRSNGKPESTRLEFELSVRQTHRNTQQMAEPASRPQPKKSKPRAADDDEESQGPTEGTGMIAKNNKMEQVDSDIKETQGVLLKTMCVLDFSFRLCIFDLFALSALAEVILLYFISNNQFLFVLPPCLLSQNRLSENPSLQFSLSLYLICMPT